MESDRVGGVSRRPRAEIAARKARRRLDRLVEKEWPELPYTMMRATQVVKTQGERRFYWRDRSVEYGDTELNLISSRSENGTSTYTAIYSREDYSAHGFHHDLLVPLHPSLKDNQLRWSAPSICDKANLTSGELVEVLLAELIAIGARGFSSRNA